ncbi:MAG: prefoldin subunit, partial [Candidatus Micrarchaeota archaeon]|nr:prefoldin subunit [Candidatus Micrarchaeota archaeon]
DQLTVQKSELDTAKDEVAKATGKVYVTIGGVIVETNKETALKNIEEKKESGEVRVQSTSKQLGELKAKEKKLRDEITALSSKMQQ